MWIFQQNVPCLKSLCNQKQHILGAFSKMMVRKGFDPKYLSTWKKASRAVGLHCLSRAQLQALLNLSSFWALRNQPVGKWWGEAGSAWVRMCACGRGAQQSLQCQPPGRDRRGQPLVFLSTEESGMVQGCLFSDSTSSLHCDETCCTKQILCSPSPRGWPFLPTAGDL